MKFDRENIISLSDFHRIRHAFVICGNSLAEIELTSLLICVEFPSSRVQTFCE